MPSSDQSSQSWPVYPCRRCKQKIRLIQTPDGWRPFELDGFGPHVCDALDKAWSNPGSQSGYQRSRPRPPQYRRDGEFKTRYD